MHIRRISVAKYPYQFKQGNYYPYPIRIHENCGYPQNIYPRIHIRASLLVIGQPYTTGTCETRLVPLTVTPTFSRCQSWVLTHVCCRSEQLAAYLTRKYYD